MKTDDLGWGVRSDPPPPPPTRTECVVRSKTGGKGVLGGPPKTKYAQNNYLGIVKKFQNNGFSHFLMV